MKYRGKLQDIEFDNDFLGVTAKAQITKGKEINSNS